MNILSSRRHGCPNSILDVPRQYPRTTALLTALALAGCAGSGTDSSTRATGGSSAESPAGGSSGPTEEPAHAPATGAAPNSPEQCTPGVPNADGLYCVVQQFGADMFKSVEGPSGHLDRITVGQTVLVACRDPRETVTSANGGWYRAPIDQFPELEGQAEYGNVAANTFENGDIVGQPINREFDPRIPVCQ